MADRQVEVFVELGGADVRAGDLWSHRRRGRESATFSYATSYLERSDAYELDPALPLVDGQLQTPAEQALFGAFTDCAPDRRGRTLVKRAERRRAEAANETARGLGEIEYLLGARDDMRQGALRFRDPESGALLAEESSGVPRLIALPRLLAASDREQRGEARDADLEDLLRGGSSLGGARPKAHVVDDGGLAAIAKFPSPADDWDVMRWEAVALALAGEAGVSVPRSRLLDVGGRAVLLVHRFDRTATGGRLGYVSAMTMLEAEDGSSRSYLEIAEAIETRSAAASEELAQLWRRVAFSVLISNTDDHLRNHGFLRESTAGWSLAPAFDLNPDPEPGPKRLSTTIGFDDGGARIDLLLGVAADFRLSEEKAGRILGEVGAATARWREVAADHGLESRAIEEMAPAFDHDQAELVRSRAAP